MQTLMGKNLERKAEPILREPVPEMPCTVTLRPASTTGLLSPSAKPMADLQNSALPEMGAYSLSRAFEAMIDSAWKKMNTLLRCSFVTFVYNTNNKTRSIRETHFIFHIDNDNLSLKFDEKRAGRAKAVARMCLLLNRIVPTNIDPINTNLPN